MIKEKMGDPRFYYGREQSWSAYFDPRSIAEDLSNDKIQAAKYGMNTLKFISENSTSGLIRTKLTKATANFSSTLFS